VFSRLKVKVIGQHARSHTHSRLRLFFWDYPCEAVPEEIFFRSLWCKRRYLKQTHQQSGWVPLHTMKMFLFWLLIDI